MFQDGDVGAGFGTALQAMSDQVTRKANQAICAGAIRAGATCVDLYAPFKGGGHDVTSLLADDGTIPRRRGTS